MLPPAELSTFASVPVANSPVTKAGGERTLLEGVIGFISVLLSYKWLIVAVTAFAALLSLTLSIASIALPPGKSPLPNTYTAVSILLMQREEGVSLESTLASLGVMPPGTAGTGTFELGQLAIRVMNSREFQDSLLEEFDFYSKFGVGREQKSRARKMLMSQAGFDYDKVTRTLNVRYTSTDPLLARDVVARMVAQLNDWFLTRGGTSKQRQRAFLDQKLKEVSAEVDRLEEQIRKFQETYGVLRVEDLAASQSQILENLRTQFRLKEIEIQNYTRFVKIEDPNLVMMKSERDNLREQIRQIESGFTNPSGTIVPAKQDLPELAQKFDNLSSALRIQKNIFEALSQQYELAKLAVEGEPVFQVLEAAEVPDLKSGPSRSKLCALTTFLALAGSCVLALSLNTLRSRLREPGFLRRLSGKI